MSDSTLTIGRLARIAGVNVETIRYYQRQGLIREPAKPDSGYRRYPHDTVARLRFIRRAQKLGFSLKDIAHLLELGEGHCADVQEQAQAKLTRIEDQIRDLEAMRESLRTLIDECESGGSETGCPIVQSLTRDETLPKPEQT